MTRKKKTTQSVLTDLSAVEMDQVVAGEREGAYDRRDISIILHENVGEDGGFVLSGAGFKGRLT